MKTIKEPKTALEAEMLIQAISDKFGMKTIILSKTDFDDMMGTEGWTDEKMDEALEIAADNLGNQVGYAIDGAIEQVKINDQFKGQ